MRQCNRYAQIDLDKYLKCLFFLQYFIHCEGEEGGTPLKENTWIKHCFF